MNDIETILKNTADKNPLVHFITNYVTANDCANMCLACHASPVMADDGDEVEDIVSLCAALVLNIGTLNRRTVCSMLQAGRKANALGKPIVFDPVGAGASTLRNETVKTFLRELEFAVIKGNSSEIRHLFGGFADTKGVDVAAQDLVTERNLTEAVRLAREMSVVSGAVIVITGPIDIVSDSARTYICRNGHSWMPEVTGTGCMLGGVIASYIAANQGELLHATAVAVAAMGICGELAHQRGRRLQAGAHAHRSLLIDAMRRLDAQTLQENMKLETR